MKNITTTTAATTTATIIKPTKATTRATTKAATTTALTLYHSSCQRVLDRLDLYALWQSLIVGKSDMAPVRKGTKTQILIFTL